MSVDISAEITRIWPTTEAKLTLATEVDYAVEKAKAVAKAKRALYGGSGTIPDEALIPDVAAYWIADQAVLYLIPLARDYYGLKRRLSDSKEGATITYPDMLKALDSLESQLSKAVQANKSDALDSISNPEALDDVPAVSTEGLMLDPFTRAMCRGPM